MTPRLSDEQPTAGVSKQRTRLVLSPLEVLSFEERLAGSRYQLRLDSYVIDLGHKRCLWNVRSASTRTNGRFPRPLLDTHLGPLDPWFCSCESDSFEPWRLQRCSVCEPASRIPRGRSTQ